MPLQPGREGRAVAQVDHGLLHAFANLRMSTRQPQYRNAARHQFRRHRGAQATAVARHDCLDHVRLLEESAR